MKFSLVLATISRKDEVEAFIKSLLIQEYKNFELLIVDQNEDDYLSDIYIKYKEILDITHIRIKAQGLSNARNVGLKYCSGDIISFPDDDCEYDKDTLIRVYQKFKNTGNDIVTFKIVDKQTKENTCGNWYVKDTKITRQNVFNTAISITIFIRKKKNDKLFFDERLGVGTKLSSGEETDFVLELLYKGYKGCYFSDICVYHPQKEKNLLRGYNYALGTGAVYYKEVMERKNYFYIFNYIKCIVGASIRIIKSFIKRNSSLIEYNKSVLSGRIKGFLLMKSLCENPEC